MSNNFEDKRKFNYFRVENETIDDEGLTGYKLLTYIVLCRYADNKTGECYPSYNKIAENMGVSRPTVIKYIKQLEDDGIITKKKNKNNNQQFYNNVYYINSFRGSKADLLGVVKEFNQGSKADLPPSKGDLHYKDSLKKTNNKKTNNKNIPYDEIKSLYNNILGSRSNFSKLRSITSKRKEHIRPRWDEELDSIDKWEDLFKQVSNTPFCCGKNDRNWIADFDWLINNDTNYVKVLEGKYKNNKQPNSKNYTDDYHKKAYEEISYGN
jgi:DNA-binding transcriptional ArsR family regulator